MRRRFRSGLRARLVLALWAVVAMYGSWYAGVWYKQARYQPQSLQLLAEDQPAPAIPANFALVLLPEGRLTHADLLSHWTLVVPVSLPANLDNPATPGARIDWLDHQLLALSRLNNRLAERPTLQGAMRYLLYPLNPASQALPLDKAAAERLLEGQMRSLLLAAHRHTALDSLFTADLNPATTPQASTPTANPQSDGPSGIEMLLIDPSGKLAGRAATLFDPASLAEDLLMISGWRDS